MSRPSPVQASEAETAVHQQPSPPFVWPYAVSNQPTGNAMAVCLSSPPAGLANTICPGPDSSNTGPNRIYRPTEGLCESGDLSDVLQATLAVGIDHLLSPYPHAPLTPSLAPEALLEDSTWCTTTPELAPNAFLSDPGANYPVTTFRNGLLRGPLTYADGGKGRLTRYPGGSAYTPGWSADSFPAHVGWPVADFSIGGTENPALDNAGLWMFIGTQNGETFSGSWVEPWNIDPVNPVELGSSVHAWNLPDTSSLPAICDPSLAVFSETYDEDGPGPSVTIVTRHWPWNYTRMLHCLYAIETSESTNVVFDAKTIDPTPVDDGGRYDIELSPRFGWVPESWRQMPTYMNGTTAWEIKRFRPMFANDLIYASSSSDLCMFRAGEGRINLGGCNSGTSFRTITALLFDTDDAASGAPTMLPDSIRYPGPSDVAVDLEVPGAAIARSTIDAAVTVTVLEDAPGDAPGLWFELTLPPGMRFVSAEPQTYDGSVEASCTTPAVSTSGVVRCRWWASIAPGESLVTDLVLEVAPPFGTDLDAAEVGVEAGSDAWDVEPSDNVASAVVGVAYPDPLVDDVALGHLFEQPIWWGLWSETTVGYADGLFHPTRDVSRQGAVAWLWRLAGSPVVACPVEFSDVPPGHLFRDAVCWAAANDITGGYVDGSFGPTLPLTRQTAMAFLFRASEPVGPLAAT